MWMEPQNFEKLCGRAQTRKWKKSLQTLDPDTNEYINLGKWLQKMGLGKPAHARYTNPTPRTKVAAFARPVQAARPGAAEAVSLQAFFKEAAPPARPPPPLPRAGGGPHEPLPIVPFLSKEVASYWAAGK